MIGSHNTLTCFQPVSFLHRLTAPLWRCQDEGFEEQLNRCDYFDIRIRFGKEGEIIFCHGIVDLNTGLLTLCGVMDRIKERGKKCRILLERTTEPSAEDTFSDLVRYLIVKYPGTLTFAAVKKNWDVIFVHIYHPEYIHDYTYKPIDTGKGWLYNLTHFRISTPRRYARRHNPIITQKMRTDTGKLHFMDFVSL